MALMSRAELTFVAGAPRANHTGAVVLLRKDNVYRLVPQHILWGEELASSFGYSVATVDLNSDRSDPRTARSARETPGMFQQLPERNALCLQNGSVAPTWMSCSFLIFLPLSLSQMDRSGSGRSQLL